MDSSVTKHNLNSFAYLEEVRVIENVYLAVGDGTRTSPTNKGSVLMMVKTNQYCSRTCNMYPRFSLNVLSCTRLYQRVISTTIEKGQCSFHYSEENNRYLGSIYFDEKEQLYLVLIKGPRRNRSKQSTSTIRRGSSMQCDTKCKQIDNLVSKEL